MRSNKELLILNKYTISKIYLFISGQPFKLPDFGYFLLMFGSILLVVIVISLLCKCKEEFLSRFCKKRRPVRESSRNTETNSDEDVPDIISMLPPPSYEVAMSNPAFVPDGVVVATPNDEPPPPSYDSIVQDGIVLRPTVTSVLNPTLNDDNSPQTLNTQSPTTVNLSGVAGSSFPCNTSTVDVVYTDANTSDEHSETHISNQDAQTGVLDHITDVQNETQDNLSDEQAEIHETVSAAHDIISDDLTEDELNSDHTLSPDFNQLRCVFNKDV